LELVGIDLLNSTLTTSLTIKAKGGSIAGTSLGGIQGKHLAKLNGKLVDLTGDIDLTGICSAVTLDDIANDVTITSEMAGAGFTLKADSIGDNVNFDLTGAVKKFQVNNYIGGSLEADTIGQVKIKQGPFGANVYARVGDILGISAPGDITGHFSAAGSINKITTKAGSFTGVARAANQIGSLQALNLNGAILSAGQNINKVNIKGDILDSYILGGYDIGSDCAFGLLRTGGGDIPGGGNVLSVAAKGTFARSYVCAGVLPHAPLTDAMVLDVALPYDGGSGSIGKVKFGSVDFGATVDFGLFAATEIKPFKIGKTVAAPLDHFLIETYSL
jgi:hypothetical protein